MPLVGKNKNGWPQSENSPTTYRVMCGTPLFRGKHWVAKWVMAWNTRGNGELLNEAEKAGL